MSATRLSIPVTGDPAQAVLQVQQAFAAAFGLRGGAIEYIRSSAGALTELQVIFDARLTGAEVAEFRRLMARAGALVGAVITAPLGSGGSVARSDTVSFEADTVGTTPDNFQVAGDVTVGVGSLFGPTSLATVPSSNAVYDLATTPLVALPDGIEPGSVSITVTKAVGGTQTITDDGAGVLTGTNGSLPGDGTINYNTGAMTGTTASLLAESDVSAEYVTITEVVGEIAATIGVAAEVYDLSVALTPGTAGIQPGSVSITVDVDGDAVRLITDDGLGVLTGAGGSLPGGGTVDYGTGEMTGTTAELTADSDVLYDYNVLASAESGPIVTVNGPTAVDLATLALDTGVVPGTFSMAVTKSSGGAQTITDDGLGVLTGTGTSLPGDGTIDYDTGALTGTTATLVGQSTVVGTYSATEALSGTSAMHIDSGAAAGTVSVSKSMQDCVGAVPAAMSWDFSLSFPVQFNLNNNGVVGVQSFFLEARLFGLLGGTSDLIVRWTGMSHDSAPGAWSAPAFVPTRPTTTPTIAMAPSMDGNWTPVSISVVGPRTLKLTVNGTVETFNFGIDLTVPKKIELAHTWTAALDKSFDLDDWSFTYQMPTPPV